jgi:hypothetical protein
MKSTPNILMWSIRTRRGPTKRRRFKRLFLPISWVYTTTSIIRMMRLRGCLSMMIKMKRRSKEKNM